MASRIGALIFLVVGICQMKSDNNDSSMWFWWLWIGICVYGVIFPYAGTQDSRNGFNDWGSGGDSRCGSDSGSDCGDE